MADTLYRDLSDWTRKAVDGYAGTDVSEGYIQGVPLSSCGDGLFSFIVNELEDAGDAEEAIRMLESARRQIDELIVALETD